MSKAKLPPCPVCRTPKNVQALAGGEFVCKQCRGLFDDRPNEGGDYFENPAKRLERSETRSVRRGR